MENKYICPKCGGNLTYWTETVIETRKQVDPITGKLCGRKTVCTASGAGNEGLECLACGWEYNTVSLRGKHSGNFITNRAA